MKLIDAIKNLYREKLIFGVFLLVTICYFIGYALGQAYGFFIK
jgi:hypothetical protein